MSFTLDNFVKNSKSRSDYFDFLKHNCNELVPTQLVIYMHVHIICNMLAKGNLIPYVEINTSKWNIPRALYTQDHTHTIQGPHTIMDHTIVNHIKQWTNHQKIVD